MIVPVDTVVTGMLVFVRASALLYSLPVFSSRAVPVLIRGMLALLLAWVVTPLADARPVEANVPALVLATVHSALIGFTLGLGVRFVFGAVEFAGHLVATEIGLAMSQGLDPTTNNNATVVQSMFTQMAMLLFFASGLYRDVLSAFVRSFSIQPAGATVFHITSVEVAVNASASIFFVALQMAAPILAVSFLINLSFAILGRVVPRMNVFMDSFAVRILGGLLILSTTVGLIARYTVNGFDAVPELMLRLVAF